MVYLVDNKYPLDGNIKHVATGNVPNVMELVRIIGYLKYMCRRSMMNVISPFIGTEYSDMKYWLLIIELFGSYESNGLKYKLVMTVMLMERDQLAPIHLGPC